MDTPPADSVKRHILQVALRLASTSGWDALQMHDLAREAGMPLNELRACFADKDAVAEGFFDLADAAVLALPRDPHWPHMTPRERLYRIITAWLDALAGHKKLVRPMLGYKLHPEHLHLQARGVARISRTVQWFRDTAQLPSTGWRREVEEAALTSIYLATFSCWMWDRSPGTATTRKLLRALLTVAEQGALGLGFATRR